MVILVLVFGRVGPAPERGIVAWGWLLCTRVVGGF